MIFFFLDLFIVQEYLAYRQWLQDTHFIFKSRELTTPLLQIAFAMRED